MSEFFNLKFIGKVAVAIIVVSAIASITGMGRLFSDPLGFTGLSRFVPPRD